MPYHGNASDEELYSPKDIDSQLYQEAQQMNPPMREENDVDYDDTFETSEARKRKLGKISRRQTNESGIQGGDMSGLEDDDPKGPKKKINKTLGKGGGGARTSGKKRAHELEDEADAVAMQLQGKMMEAYNLDLDEFQKGRPGLHRFNLLPTVISVMSKAYNQAALLEVGILQEVRLFLEPLPDGTLPIVNIQRELLTVLAQMPITVEMFRTSYVGRIVKFYASSERITQEPTNSMTRWTNMINRQTQAANNRRIGVGPPKKFADVQSEKSKQPDVRKRLLTTMSKLKLSNRKR
ncbi:Transcription factor iws1 [Massospora cicadina]|nr:Transcription factor iws1 [Massospora cicadina]